MTGKEEGKNASTKCISLKFLWYDTCIKLSCFSQQWKLMVEGARERWGWWWWWGDIYTFWLKILLESQGAAGEKVLLFLPVNFLLLGRCMGCNDVKIHSRMGIHSVS